MVLWPLRHIINTTQMLSTNKGGTAIIARDQLGHQSYERLHEKLGRWMMMSFRSKDGMALRVLACYRPQSTRGPFTVYQQQLSYFEDEGNTKEVLDNYNEDLFKHVKGWMDKGDQIILILNVNADLATNEDGFGCKLKTIGLKELILSKPHHLKPPPIRIPGTKTIDGIFGTAVLEVMHA